MPNILFTADQHYFSKNIIHRYNRPFSCVEEMNEEMIHRHNKVVGKTDTIYMLGDVCWSGHHKEILPRLNGNKILIRGNHDKTAHFKGNLVQVIYDTKMIEVECQRIWLSHYAHRSWNCSFHGSWHLYGHSHGMLEDYGLSTDVGVDCWDFYPVSFEEIKQHMKGKERWRTC